MGHISKSSSGLIHWQKAASLSRAPKRHYGFWRVELCCHLVRTSAMVIRQEHDLMCPWDTGQVEILLLWNLWLCLNHEGSCGAWILSNRGSWLLLRSLRSPLLSQCSGDWNSVLAVWRICSVTLGRSVSTCPPVKGDVGADFLCILCGEPYKKTEIRGKCCNAIWYHKTTTRIFYSIPGEIKTYADLISYDFCKLHLPRNGRQKSDHNRSVRFDEKSTEEAGLLQHHGDGSDWSPAAKAD